MTVLTFDSLGDRVDFTPISTGLSNLSNGPGTIAVLFRRDGGTSDDLAGLVNSANTDWYHALGINNTGTIMNDDVGPFFVAASSGGIPTGTTADDFVICAVTWPSGVAKERFHFSSKITTAESWTHTDSVGNKNADRAGPGTTGIFSVGYTIDWGTLNGAMALVAAWVGTQLSDAQIEDLWISKKTSDWCNHPAGQPTFLSEFTSLTPTDIGANPSTFSTVGTATLASTNPTGWTFDGCPAVPPPDVHIAWTTA